MGALRETLAELLEVKRCTWCSITFTDFDEIGCLRCRVHPGFMQACGTLVYGTAERTYSCCGAARDPTHRQYRGRAAARGCVPCDHTDRPGKAPPLVIPLEQARVLLGDELLADASRPGVRVDENAGAVFISRYGPEP